MKWFASLSRLPFCGVQYLVSALQSEQRGKGANEFVRISSDSLVLVGVSGTGCERVVSRQLACVWRMQERSASFAGWRRGHGDV